jgi:acyl-CoA thioesterase I
VEQSTVGRIWNCLVTGDSISKGVVYDEATGKYSILEANYVSLVQRKLKNIVRNVSRFGSTLPRGRGRLAREIATEKPDIVLLEYGGNDCDFDWNEIAAHPEVAHEPNTDLALFESTLTETVETLKEEGIVPVLMTLPPLDADKFLKWVSRNDQGAEGSILKWLGSVTPIYWWQERYSSMISRVAEKTKTRSIDIRGAFLREEDFPGLICKDGIHPNAAGHRVIAEAVLDYISSDYPFMLAESPSASMGYPA